MAAARAFKLLSVSLFLIFALLVSLHSRVVLSSAVVEDFILDEEDDDIYILDKRPGGFGSRSRLLARYVVKKGDRCDPKGYNNKCKGVAANDGTSLLYCCKNHCRNVLRDENNCGRCGFKCKYGQRCCGGVCTNVLSNASHCGKCDRKCPYGFRCEYGSCGYA